MPKSKEFESDSDDSSEEEVKSKKKQKREKAKEKKKPGKKQKTDEKNIWKLGNNRQVTVENFKGEYYINIREYYEKDGDLKPGRKGIFLTMPQWRKFVEVVEEVDEVAKSKC